MSWQTYVDDHLMCEIEGNHLTSAAIIGLDGSVWAQSSNFPQVTLDVSTLSCSWAAQNFFRASWILGSQLSTRLFFPSSKTPPLWNRYIWADRAHLSRSYRDLALDGCDLHISFLNLWTTHFPVWVGWLRKRLLGWIKREKNPWIFCISWVHWILLEKK